MFHVRVIGSCVVLNSSQGLNDAGELPSFLPQLICKTHFLLSSLPSLPSRPQSSIPTIASIAIIIIIIIISSQVHTQLLGCLTYDFEHFTSLAKHPLSHELTLSS